MENNLLWIDDQPQAFELSIQNFAREGFMINGISNMDTVKDEIQKSINSYSAVFLDLDLQGKFTGIHLLKQIRSLNRNIPVYIVTAQLGFHNWNQRLDIAEKELNERLPRISKPIPLTTSPEFLDLKNRLNTSMKTYSLINNPFSCTLEDYLELEKKDRRKVNNSALKLTNEFRDRFFNEHPNIDWILIGNNPTNIVKSGPYKELPKEGDMMKISRSINSPVFAYSRPKVIEETKKTWTYVEEDDYYPTITLKIKDVIVRSDFDTGSPYSFLSFEYLEDKGLIKSKIFEVASSDKVFGGKYYYYPEDIEFEIEELKNGKELVINIEAVEDWLNSPLTKHYKNRIGLIGRNLIINNNLRVLLDGKSKTTKFLSNELD